VRDEVLPRNPGGKVLKPVLRETAAWQAVSHPTAGRGVGSRGRGLRGS
jgi:hypothetical protein